MAIIDLPGWGEVRLFIASRPLSAEEKAECRRLIDQILREWAAESRAIRGLDVRIAPAEVLVEQIIAVGSAARRPTGNHHESEPYLMTGSDFDPLLDGLDRYAVSREPHLSFFSDDAVALPAEVAPFSKALLSLAEGGRLDRSVPVVMGRPIARWQALGAVHPIGSDEELYEYLRAEVAKRGIMIS